MMMMMKHQYVRIGNQTTNSTHIGNITNRKE